MRSRWPNFILANVHSQINLQMCAKCGNHQMWCQSVQQFSTFPIFLHFDPLKIPPLGVRGLNILADVHSKINPHMCAKFGGNRSSRFVAFQDLIF